MTNKEKQKDENAVGAVRMRLEKREHQALQVSRSLEGRRRGGFKKRVLTREDLSEDEEYLLRDEELVICEHQPLESTSSKKQRLNNDQIAERREILDRDFSLALAAAEKERSYQHKHLKTLENLQERQLSEMKKLVEDNNKLLQRMINNQQVFFDQTMHLMRDLATNRNPCSCQHKH